MHRGRKGKIDIADEEWTLCICVTCVYARCPMLLWVPTQKDLGERDYFDSIQESVTVCICSKSNTVNSEIIGVLPLLYALPEVLFFLLQYCILGQLVFGKQDLAYRSPSKS